jgi:TatD family-associated radical SAM protein
LAKEGKAKTVYWLENKLYLNITNKCSNHCCFCIRKFKKGVGGFNLKLAKEPSITQIVSELEKAIHKKNWTELVFCGFGEPTQRLDLLLEITRWIRRKYRKNLIIRVNTNGHSYALNPNRNIAKELKIAGVNRLSVSLNAHNKETYDEICKPKIENAYEAVLDFIKNAREMLEVEVTAVTTPEIEPRKVEAIAKKLGVKFRIRQYIPCFW